MAYTDDELREYFAMHDPEGSGKVSIDYIKQTLHACGQVMSFAESKIEDFLAELDEIHNGFLTCEQFCEMMRKHGVQSSKLTRREVQKCFQTIDVDCSGYITTAELRHMMTELNWMGQEFGDDVMDAIMDSMDTTGNGQCGLQEFIAVLTELGFQVVTDEDEEDEGETIKLSAPRKVVDTPHKPVAFGSEELKSLLAPVTAADGTINAAELSRAMELLATNKSLSSHDPHANKSLHWDPSRGIRGLGEVLYKMNHLAITVSDIGRSSDFYANVIGLQQIRRPDFDRHGAWFTMGNCELHLIKGNPIVHTGDDLIVGHIALETYDIDRVPQILKAKGIPFRQNVSVPKGVMTQGAGTNDSNNSQAIVKQYFIRDPDGYYLEVCNCDILTDYCLGKKENLAGYNEAIKPINVQDAALVELILMRLNKKGRSRAVRMKQLIDKYEGHPVEEIAAAIGATPAETVDAVKLKALVTRRTVYGDVCQSLTEDELENVLKYANNDMRRAIDIITIHVGNDLHYSPPAFYEEGKDKVKPPSIIPAKAHRNKANDQGYLPKV